VAWAALGALALSALVLQRTVERVVHAPTPRVHRLITLAETATRLPPPAPWLPPLVAGAADGDGVAALAAQLAAAGAVTVGNLTHCVPGFEATPDAPDAGECALRPADVLVATYYTAPRDALEQASPLIAAVASVMRWFGAHGTTSGRFEALAAPGCDLLTLLRRNRGAYAAAHGYSWAIETTVLDPSRPAAWGKVLAAMRWLRLFKVVLLVDADAFITNLDRPLTSTRSRPCTCDDLPDVCVNNPLPPLTCLDDGPPPAGGALPHMLAPMGDNAAAQGLRQATVSYDAARGYIALPGGVVSRRDDLPVEDSLDSGDSGGGGGGGGGPLTPAWLADDTGDVILSTDPAGINSGVMVLKASAWTVGWLQHVYAQSQFTESGLWEQAAMQHVLTTTPDSRRHVYLASQTVMNSYSSSTAPPSAAWRRGDFILHFAGLKYGLGDAVAGLRSRASHATPLPPLSATAAADGADATDPAWFLSCVPPRWDASSGWLLTMPVLSAAAPAFVPNTPLVS